MMNMIDFLTLTPEQEHEMLLAAYDALENALDRYRTLMAMEALAKGEEYEP